MPDTTKAVKEMTAQEAKEKADRTEAELLQVLNRGATIDRLGVKNPDPGRHYEWCRDEDSQITRWKTLGYTVDTDDEKDPTGLHGTGDNRIVVGDVVRVSCTMERYELLEKLKAQRKEKRRKLNAKKQHVQKMRKDNPLVPVLDPLNEGGSED